MAAAAAVVVANAVVVVAVTESDGKDTAVVDGCVADVVVGK